MAYIGRQSSNSFITAEGYIHENEFYTKNIVSGSNHDNDTTITTNNNNSSNNNNNNTINNGNKKPTMGGSSFMFDGATEERMTKSIEKLTHTLTTFYNTFNKSLSEVTNNKNNNDEKKNRNNDTKESNEESEGFEVCRNAGGDRRLVSVVIVGRKTWECMGEEKEYDEVVFVILTSREKVEGWVGGWVVRMGWWWVDWWFGWGLSGLVDS